MRRDEQRTTAGVRRMSRRRLVEGVTGLGVASAFLAACGGDSDNESSGSSAPANAPQVSQSQNTTEQAQPGGIYQGFTTTDITNFDPIAATGNVDRGVAAWATSRLFRFQPGVNEPSKGEVVGDLVESYEINLNALQVTMKLRPNAKWDPRAPTNSRPLDSQDIKFSWDKFKAQSVYRRDWMSELNPAAPFVDVETPDARTAVLKLNYPLGAVFDYLGGRGRSLYQCRDGGWVSFVIPPDFWDNFVTWLVEHDIAGDLLDPRWRDPAVRLEDSSPVNAATAQLATRYDRDDLFHEAQRRRLLCMPVNTVADLARDEQLHARGYFVPVEHPDLGATLTYPGAPFVLSETPWRIHHPAPSRGEHNADVFLRDLGLTPDELAILQRRGVV